MQIRARDLAVGDVLRLHDWKLHVVGVDCDSAVAVLTTELGFLIHFGRDELVDVSNRMAARRTIPRAA